MGLLDGRLDLEWETIEPKPLWSGSLKVVAEVIGDVCARGGCRGVPMLWWTGDAPTGAEDRVKEDEEAPKAVRCTLCFPWVAAEACDDCSMSSISSWSEPTLACSA